MIRYVLFCAGPNYIRFFNECPGPFENNKILHTCLKNFGPVAFFEVDKKPSYTSTYHIYVRASKTPPQAYPAGLEAESSSTSIMCVCVCGGGGG